MSLDVYLEVDTSELRVASDMCEERGFLMAADSLRRHAEEILFEGNITHNLGNMANAAGIYRALWRPEEIGIVYARQLIEPLREGLRLLRDDPAKFTALNPTNGWGNYDGLVAFVVHYLEAATRHPQAVVRACR